MGDYPELVHTVLDAVDVRGLAEFYRQLLGLAYRPGDEPPVAGLEDAADWLVLRNETGANVLAFQQVEQVTPTTWPAPDVPMQLHLDFLVPSIAELQRHRDCAVELGAQVRLDRTDDIDEPLLVFTDPAGHPFCVFVS